MVRTGSSLRCWTVTGYEAVVMGHERERFFGRRRNQAEHRYADQRHADHRGDGEFQGVEGDEDGPPLPGTPVILPRDQHSISRRHIDSDALKVMTRLIRHGYRAYLVGGGVRDLLLGKQPKDFDIGTDATPEAIRSLFRNSRFIGRRFRIVHIYFGGNKIFELSTFRRTSEDDTENEAEGNGNRGDNTWGDPQTDALRRDLTINGLFYDLKTFAVIDYVGGIEDLRAKTIRVIGDPDVRFREDPVRMIRAIRHSARADFVIEPITYEAIKRNASLIATCSPARVFEEFTRELRGGVADASLTLLQETGLLEHLVPPLCAALRAGGPSANELLHATLGRLDEEAKRDPEIPLSVVFLALLVGNVPESFMAEDLPPSHHETLLALWRPVPMLQEADEQHRNSTDSDTSEDYDEYDDDEPSEAERPLPPNRRVAVQVAESSIEALFHPIGVPRRERERMRQLLCARAELFQAFFARQTPRSLFHRAYFPDVLRVLRLTAHAPVIEDCLAWVDEHGSNEGGERRRRRRRGRGRRPRGS